MLKLDFSIVSAKDRAEAVNKWYQDNPDYRPTKKELETISNYILYGKDPYINKKGEYDETLPVKKWTNCTQRKEIEIKSKYGTWDKKHPISLDETMENPAFFEVDLLTPKVIPKAIKQNFARESNADIPTIEFLWSAIDKIEKALENDQNLTPTERYKMRHMVIEMRKQQYTMREAYKPPVVLHGSNKKTGIYIQDWDEKEIAWIDKNSSYGVAPMGFYHKGDARFEDPLSLQEEKDDWGYNKDATYIIDFCNKDHIDKIVYFLEDLETYCSVYFMSDKQGIIDTFWYYVKECALGEMLEDILRMKIAHITNDNIAKMINKKYEKKYNSNYISTLYTKICGKIAKTADLRFRYYINRMNPEKFKRCSCCGKMKLRTTEEFTRKSRNSDGLNNKCKECQHGKK